MSATANRRAAFWALLSANLILFSCSGTNAPEPGTPAFYWGAAKVTYNAGDYQKTVETLGNLLSTQNEYVARARPWMLVLTSGMCRGYMDLADAYEAGSHASRSQTTAFHRQLNEYRDFANRMALQFAENFAKFDNKDEYVPLAFPYPTGSPTEVVILNKVADGGLLPEQEAETAQKRAIERAVLLNTCKAAGASDDPAKVQDLLKTADAKVPRATFIYAMASNLFDESKLYSRGKLDDPDKLKIFCTRAQDALKQLPSSKESEALNKKIEAVLKKAKA
jgi:hypothetical protein